MNRNQFIDILARKLSKMPEKELKQTIDYYYEIISDKMNDGMTEEQAIESLGSLDEIVTDTLSDASDSCETVKEKKESKWKNITIGATAIIWVPVLIGLFGGLIALYISLWAIVISLGAITLATGVGTLVSILGIVDICTGAVASGLTIISMGIGSLGLSFIFYTITVYSGKGMILLTRKIFTTNFKNKTRGGKYEN